MAPNAANTHARSAHRKHSGAAYATRPRNGCTPHGGTAARVPSGIRWGSGACVATAARVGTEASRVNAMITSRSVSSKTKYLKDAAVQEWWYGRAAWRSCVRRALWSATGGAALEPSLSAAIAEKTHVTFEHVHM
jgi:hypothetical protein